MPTGPQGQKRPRDTNACAVLVCRIATGELEETKPPQQALAGKIGGKARAAKLSPERRKEIAQMGVQARKAKRQ